MVLGLFRRKKKSTLDPTVLPPHFPLSISSCSAPSSALFSCLEDPSVPSPSSCSSFMSAYNDCYASAIDRSDNERYRREREEVPEDYRWQP